MASKVFQISKEQQHKQKLAELRQEMADIEVEPPTPSPVIEETLESLVENELKKQLKLGVPPAWAIPNAIKFLAVRAKLPVTFGSELDQ